MASIVITLRRINNYEWQLFAPKGHPISPKYRGDRYNALDWAQAFISGWSNWTIRLEGENDNEEEN